MTLTDQILVFIDQHPGRTAWGISKELGRCASVSSILRKLAMSKRVLRRKGMNDSWTYYPNKKVI